MKRAITYLLRRIIIAYRLTIGKRRNQEIERSVSNCSRDRFPCKNAALSGRKRTMQAGRRRKTVGIGCLFLGLAVLLVWLWATRTPALLDHAHRITEGQYESYAWQSTNKLVLLSAPTDQGMPYVLLDLTTGIQTLHSLSSFQTSLTYNGLTARTMALRCSPNGSWAVGADSDTKFHLLSLGEEAEHDYRFDDYYEREGGTTGEAGIAWLPDGRRWLAWSPTSRKTPLRLFSVDAPHSPSVRLSPPSGMSRLLGVTPDNLVVMTKVPAPPALSNSAEIHTFGVYPNRAADRSWSFALPSTAEVSTIELSPQGERLAWLLVYSRRPALVTLLSRLLPFLAAKFPPVEGVSVWVSGLDGKAMREIGFQEMPRNGTAPDRVTELRWMPDGKHLSFLHRHALYSIPVP